MIVRPGLSSILRIAVTTVALVLLAGAAVAGVSKRETRLLTLPHQVLGDTIVVTPDGDSVGYVLGVGERRKVVIDGDERWRWDAVQVVVDGSVKGTYTHASRPYFSPNGHRVAWIAEREGREFAVVDGVEGKPYDGVAYERVEFSPDSRTVAFNAREGHSSFIVVNGVEGPRCDRICELTFSPDSSRIAYVATRGDRQILVVDGEELAEHDQVVSVDFSKDGKRFIYGMVQNGKEYAVVNGVKHGGYDWMQQPRFSPDGSRVGYVARIGDRTFTFIDDKATAGSSAPLFSQDGRRVAYGLDVEGGQVVVVDGQRSRPYDMVFPSAFSPDGKHFAFVARDGDTWKVVLDGRELPAYDGSVYLVLSPDGEHVAYSAMSGNTWLLLIDGRVVARHDMLCANSVGEVALAFESPDSFSATVIRGWDVVRIEGTVTD